MPTIVMDTLFNNQTNINKWFTSPPDPVSGEAIRNGRLDTDGVDTYMEINIGTAAPGSLEFSRFVIMTVADQLYNIGYNSPAGTTAYCYDDDPALAGRYVKVGGAVSIDWGPKLPWMPTNTRSFSNKTEMLADTVSPVGTWGHCYGTVAAEHGSYKKIANGNWGSRLGPVHELLFQDPNHIVPIELILRSFGLPGDPGAPNYLGWPDIADWDGHEIIYEMRVFNLRMGRNSAIVQHFQNYIPGQTRPEEISTQRAFSNTFQQKNTIHNQLKMGGDYYTANAVKGVDASGWVEVRIPMRALASDWFQLGSVNGRNGLGGDSGSYYKYCAEHPSVFLKRPNVQVSGAVGAMNAFMIVAHRSVDNSYPIDSDRIKGTFQFRRIRVEKI